MATRMTTSAVTQEARDILSAGERIVVSDGTTDVLGIVPIEDLRFLEALEDARDIADARAAIAEDEATGGAGRVSLAEAYVRLRSHEPAP
ncbi:MAG TPA: hypothetical protein VGM37_17705 [Armatimonadota bacterium]|jgi:hypothetical protein